jgi:mycothiol synthase
MATEYRTFEPGMIEKLADVMNSSGKEQPYYVPMPADQLRIAILENPDYDPEGIIMVSDQGKAIGACAAAWSKSRVEYGLSQGSVQIGVVPERRGEGIEQELMKRSLIYLKGKNIKEALFGSNIATAWKLALAKEFEFSEMRRMYKLIRPMSTEILTVPIPDGVVIESKDIHDAERGFLEEFHGTLNIAFKDHFNFSPLPLEQLMMLRKVPGIDSLCILARTSDRKPVGICLAMIEPQNDPGKGDINAVGVIPEYRKKGIAKAVMSHALKWFESKGVTDTSLGMEAQNARALNLYTQLGFEIKSESIMFRLAL